MPGAVICIINHPGMFSFFYHLSKLSARLGKRHAFILIKVDHPYFTNTPHLNFWEEAFDEVINLQNVLYEKNLFKGLRALKRCNQEIRKAISRLTDQYGELVVLLNSSAMYPMNKFLAMLNGQRSVKKLYRLSIYESSNFTTVDWKRTALARIYTFIGGAYSVNSVRFSGNVGMDFQFRKNVPGEFLQITSGYIPENSSSNKNAPFPVWKRRSEEKNLVIFFGDYSFFEYYRTDLDCKADYVEKVKRIVRELEAKYNGCELWYKCHPLDNEVVMDGIESSSFRVLGSDSGNAEYLLDQYGDRIRAVYSLQSTASFSAAMRLVPAYVLFPLLVKEGNLQRLHFQQAACFDPKRLFPVRSFEDLGRIDFEGDQSEESSHIETRWREIALSQ